jgi:hypothetical protein
MRLASDQRGFVGPCEIGEMRSTGGLGPIVPSDIAVVFVGIRGFDQDGAVHEAAAALASPRRRQAMMHAALSL